MYIRISKTALSLTFVNVLLFTILYLLLGLNHSLLYYFLIAIFFIASFYLINVYVLNAFAGNNIDKIYEILNSPKGEKNKRKKKKSLVEVEAEVGSWVNSKDFEIMNLKTQENYRKEFLGNISHELKTPIFIAQSYIETLLDGSINDKNVNRKHLKKSLKSIVRLSTIVNELEMISQLESDTSKLIKENFDINSLIYEVVDSLEIKIKNEDTKILYQDNIAEPCFVFANRDKIEQVIYNLLDNALKYSKKKNSWIKIICYPLDSKCIIEIEDNGIGIKQEDIPRIFERFYRVDKNRSRKKGGSGLGLSIVKHILEAHNQEINVKSEYGKGTKFSFSLAISDN